MAARILRSRRLLSESKLADIGSVVVESAFCDHMIERLIWALAGIQAQRGKFFTNRMQLDKKLDLLSDLGKQWVVGNRNLKTFTKIVSDLKIANNERNIIVHGEWRPGLTLADFLNAPVPGKRLRNVPKSIRRRLRSPHEEFSARKIRGTARRISLLTQKLRAFAMAQWPRLP